MDEQRFRQLALERGYGDFQAMAYVPHNDGPLHKHAFSVMLLHTERAGPEGASVLLAKRMAVQHPEGTS